jgi:DNA-binding MarR family transcriptional regulator
MNIQPELLRINNLNPLQKLILGLIIDTPLAVIQMAGGCDKTCGEIGKLLGVSRARILKELEILVKLDLISSKKGDATRLTNVTQRLKELLN